MFRTVWGADRDNEGEPRPLDNTSYGHNIEFLWLFLHALEVLGESVDPWRERLSALARQTARFGVDRHTAACSSKARTTALPGTRRRSSGSRRSLSSASWTPTSSWATECTGTRS